MIFVNCLCLFFKISFLVYKVITSSVTAAAAVVKKILDIICTFIMPLHHSNDTGLLVCGPANGKLDAVHV